MPEAREEDEREQIPISVKPASLATPKRDSELKELIEDLSRMGWGVTRQTLESSGGGHIAGFSVWEGKSVDPDNEAGAEEMDAGSMGWSLRVSERKGRGLG